MSLQGVPGSGAIYHECTISELKGFAAARGVKVPSPKLKWQYVAGLKKADGERTFHRFLDLAPELRNMIYSYLSVLRQKSLHGNRQVANPEILSTSRDIHAEAVGILYGENTFNLDLMTKYADRYGSTTSVRMTSTEWEIPENWWITPKAQLLEGIDHWPVYLRRVERLHVTIELRKGGAHMPRGAPILYSWALFTINHTLYNICSLMMGQHSLKYLQVDFKQAGHHSDLEASTLKDILWPMTRLGKISEVHLTGLEDEVASALLATMEQAGTCTGIFRTLAAYQTLTEEARAVIALAVRADCQEYPPQSGSSHARILFDALMVVEEDWSSNTLMSSAREELLKTNLKMLQELLKDVDVEKLKKGARLRKKKFDRLYRKLEASSEPLASASLDF